MYPEHAYTDFREAVAAWLGTRPGRIVPGHGIQALIATVAHAFLDPGDAVVVPRPPTGSTRRSPRRRAHGRDASRDGIIDTTSRPSRTRPAARTPARLALRPEQPDGLSSRRRRMAGAPRRPSGALRRGRRRGLRRVRPPRAAPRREADVEAGRPVIVLRTFSKIFGLAGLRLGYAVRTKRSRPSSTSSRSPSTSTGRRSRPDARASDIRTSSRSGAWRTKRRARRWPAPRARAPTVPLGGQLPSRRRGNRRPGGRGRLSCARLAHPPRPRLRHARLHQGHDRARDL